MIKGLNCGIYQILNLIDGKRYIGSSTNLKAREYNHFYELKRNKHANSYLQHSYNLHGAENFVFEILCYCDKDTDYLFYLEDHLIKSCKSNTRQAGYNILIDANSCFGMKRTEEQKQKMSERRLSLHYKHSEETKQKMRDTKGHRKPFTMSFRTEEHLRKISESKKGRHPNFTPEDMEFRKNRMLGEKNHNAALKEEDVRQIRILLAQNFLGTEVAEKFGVNSSTIYRIRDGKTWAHLI